MDFKDILKKFWFVMIIALVFLGYVIALTIQTVKEKPYEVKSKEVNGQSVIYSVDGTNYFADDLYNDLYSNFGENQVWQSFYKSVIKNGIESTDELNNYASYMAQYYLYSYDESQLTSMLNSYGYNSLDDLTNYFLDQAKVTTLISDYLIANYDEYVAPVVEKVAPKKIYHILVKVADVSEEKDENGNTYHVANPTEEESKKINDALNELKNGADFKDVAVKYSEDTSAAQGGLLGIVTKNTTNLVQEFKDACDVVEIGSTTDIITTTYGYHIIYAENAEIDELTSDSQFITEVTNNFPNVQLKAIMEKADELGYVLYEEHLKAEIEASLASESEAQ